MKPVTIPSLLSMKKKGERIAVLTAYDATFARLIDEAGIDLILVGDSLGMVIQGHATTIPVTLDEVIYHCSCVSRGVRRALIIADLPFMSYQSSPSQALLAAGRALKEGGAQAVKIEGGQEMVKTVELMVAAGIPVMAHIGLKPQRVNQMGGYVIQGRSVSEAKALIAEAEAFERAGAFSILLEGVAMESAQEITKSVSIPTIGIAAGPNCSGQVLVLHDMLGLNPKFRPTFLTCYAEGWNIFSAAVTDYISDVREGRFPSEEQGFHRK